MIARTLGPATRVVTPMSPARYAACMTQLQYGRIKVSVRAAGSEVTSEITAGLPAEHRLRFEVETGAGARVRPTDAEVAARFYLSNHMMQFTIGLPGHVQGVNTLHVYVDGALESSLPFTVPVA
jgi:hypothetical protein